MAMYAGILFIYGSLLLWLSHRNDEEEKRQQNWQPMENVPTLSILVACRNEENHLPQLLEDLMEQSYPAEKREVFLVNDHSDDNTQVLFQEWKKAHPEVPFAMISLPEGKQGKKEAITEGLSHCTGQFVLFTDADCRLPFHWAMDMVTCQQHSAADMVCGSIKINHPDWTSKGEALEFSSLIAAGAASIALQKPSLCNGANYLVDKQALTEANASRKDSGLASGDDVYLLHSLVRAGKKIAFCRLPLSFVTTYPQSSWRDFIHQRIRWAGKWNSGLPGANKSLAVSVWLFHLLFLLGLPMTFSQFGFNGLLIVLAWKAVCETFFLEPFLIRTGYRENSWAVWLAQIPYSIYVLCMGIAVWFSKGYVWKGRQVVR